MQVPFCLVGGADKRVLGAGNPKTLDIPALLQQASASSGSGSGSSSNSGGNSGGDTAATGGGLDNSLFTDDDF